MACPEGALAVRARAAGIEVVAIRGHRSNVRGSVADRLSAPARLLAHALEVAGGWCATLRPDAVVGWGMRSAIACLALPERYPLAIAHHDMLPGPLIAAAVRRAARRAIGRDRPVGGRRARSRSRGTADRAAAGRQPGRRSRAVRGANGRRCDPPEVLMLGALVAWKRPDLALEACALARRTVPGAAPAARRRAAVRRRRRVAPAARTSAAVRPGGRGRDRRRRDRRGAGAGARGCLLHCAPAEPFGLVVVEALAAGCPVVVPASGGAGRDRRRGVRRCLLRRAMPRRPPGRSSRS